MIIGRPHPVEATPVIRHDWTADEVAELFALPFPELLYRAQSIHRTHWNPDEVQACTLLSIKTGACPEDCAYCPQSVHHHTELKPEPLMDAERVLEEARAAQAAGASRFCMGAAWRSPKPSHMSALVRMVRGVKELGMESCMTLGMLSDAQARQLAAAGLDYYNHNLDSSPEFYRKIITTRRYEERLETLGHVRAAGINVCCGGIIGMGESEHERIGLLLQLANLPQHPQSVPINLLVKVPGTPLEDVAPLHPLDFVRCVAAARILMPVSYVRLSAGREDMSDECQTLAFMAGANSIFYGEHLLTTDNPDTNADDDLLARLGMRFAPPQLPGAATAQCG